MLTPLPPTIPHAAMQAAARWGSAPALIERGETWSFAELWEQCRRAAAAFLAVGAGPGDRIAIWAPNSREWIVAAVGAMTCGASIVPVNTRLKGREAGDILRRTRARMLFTVDDFLGLDFAALLSCETLPDLESTIAMDSGWEAFLGRSKAIDTGWIDTALARLSPDDISDIIFTSGTTGAPKGVLMTYARVIPQVGVWIGNTGLGEGERYLIVNPFFHSFGLKVGWVACLIAGATIVPMAQFEAREAARIIEEQRIGFLPGPPTIFQMLLDEKQARPFDSSSLRGGTTGAATVPPVLVERIIGELGMRDIVTAYGMTECVNITSCRPGDSVERIATTCGAAIPGNEVIVAGEDGRELPRGETGEIRVRGQGVMLGYLDDPAATAEAIDADGWLHTGDVGTMDADGYVRITDRKKDMYISGGFNCYPAEIEKLLAEHPAVSMSAVIGVPDDRMGEVGRAFVVLRPGASADEGELIAWSRRNMANYKVPRSFAVVDDLPRNASGKVLKTELR
jgi:acyl-CoA synthetase (AMP-forming)/AMP-acid ligase II